MMWRRTMHKTAGEIGRSTTPSGRNKKTEEEEHKCRLRENLWDEFLIRSSRPRPPMFMPKSPIEQQKRQEQFHKKYYNQPKSSITSSPLFVGHSLEEPSPAELAKLLKVLNEKEQDLQLAAKLGNSLLQENKELQEKNQFLEESLASSEETVVQLQKTLKQRSKLFHTIIDLENEHEELGQKQEGLDLKSEELLRLERQLKQVESENKELRMKNKHLDELKAIVEKREEQRISEQMSQLRGANLKIAQLQVQLNEKGQQCETQADEVHRLLKEIAQRKTREKMLWNENDDIKAQLDEALLSHEQLRHEMEQLQERHTDLISMLRETEDELRMHREKALAPPPRRTNSTDSLYDSLASELEGADSGCYNTPMFSARYGPSPHGSSLSAGGDQQPTCSASSSATTNSNQQGMEPILERKLIADDVAENNKGNGQQNHRQQQSFDVPSRALLEVVRSTFEDRRKFRQMSPTRQQQRNLQQLQKFAEHRRRTASEMSDENGVEKNDGVEADLSTPIATNKTTIGGHLKSYKDAACSPIQFTKTDVESSATPSSRNLVAFSSSSAESVDSLDDYNPPKLGAPGRPGTKDLDFSIKRLNLWKWTEFVCSAVSSPSKENSMPSSKSMPFSNSMPISEMLTINTSTGILQRCDHQLNDEIMSPSTENSMPISEMLTTMRSSASTGILQRCDQLNGC